MWGGRGGDVVSKTVATELWNAGGTVNGGGGGACWEESTRLSAHQRAPSREAEVCVWGGGGGAVGFPEEQPAPAPEAN